MNPEPVSAGDPKRRRRIALGGAAAALLTLIVVLVAVLPGREQDARAPGASATPGSAASPGAPTPSSPKTPQPAPPVPPVVTKTPKPMGASFGEEIELDNGVAIEVSDIESVKGEARGPGEVAGPALRFTVRVDNKSRKTINLDLAIVTAYSGKRDDPAIDLSGPGVSPLPPTLKSGATASGTYVFAIPIKERGRVRVDFGYTVEQPRIVFRGPGD